MSTKGFPTMTIIMYIAAVIVGVVFFYYINYIYNAPQPLVYMAYNSVAQAGIGYVNDTLSYPIEITSIYCSEPNGAKEVFGAPNNNTLMPGTNTIIEIGITNQLIKLTTNCTNWKVSYDQLPANTPAPNSPIKEELPTPSKSPNSSSSNP